MLYATRTGSSPFPEARWVTWRASCSTCSGLSPVSHTAWGVRIIAEMSAAASFSPAERSWATWRRASW